jgi:O-antigen ligase
MAEVSPLPRVAVFFDRAALWIAVAIGFSIPISTALDNVLVAALLLCWVTGGRYREKIAAIRGNVFAILACALFLLYLAGSLYSVGAGKDVLHALDKASVLLLIPVVISLNPGTEFRDRALHAFMAAVLLTLVLSYLLWLELLPQGPLIKGEPSDPVIFKLRITHGVLIAFGAFLFALKAREAADLRWRMVWALGAVLAAFNVLIMVQGRTGQLVLIVLLLYFLISSFRWRGLLAAVAAGLAIGGTVYLTPSSALHQRVLTTIIEYQDWQAGRPPTLLANMRLESWSNSLKIVREHPLVGVGTGGFAAAYAKQVESTSMMPLAQPENQYLLTTVQLGVVGLAALLALFAMQWHLASRLATRSDTDLARGLVITMAVGCMFNSFLLDHTEALFYAWLSGLLFAGLQSRETHPQ